LVIARNESQSYGDILESTYGLVFFEAPHGGPDFAYWGTLAAKIQDAFPGYFGARPQLMKDSIRNLSAFSRVTHDFRHIAEKLRIETFYETEKYKSALVRSEFHSGDCDPSADRS
jgi:hypothetical protein